jgi:hypothetical protein
MKCPLLEFRRRGGTEIGEKGIEQERTEPGGGHGSGEGRELAIARGGGVAGVELSARQADLGAIPGRRRKGATAREPTGALYRLEKRVRDRPMRRSGCAEKWR